MRQLSDHPHREDTPAERLVQLLERHGLEESLRDILRAMEADKT